MAESARRGREEPTRSGASSTALRLTDATAEAFADLSLGAERVEEWSYQLRRVVRLNVMGAATWLTLALMDAKIVKRLTKWRMA